MHAAIYVCQDLWPNHVTELATARRIEGWNRTGYPSGPVRRYATRPLPIVHVSPLRSVSPFSQVETKTTVSGLGTANGSENISVLGMSTLIVARPARVMRCRSSLASGDR